MQSLREAALAYAERGWPVFPCRADKKPYTEHGVLEATTNKRKINKWWDEFPRANIGLDVGGAGMVALDLDTYKPDFDIEEVRDALDHELVTELVQSTPRGGTHLFFQLGRGEKIPPSSSKVAKNVDVRSFHSYVLLAPSRTQDGEYAWVSEGKPMQRPAFLMEMAKEAREKDEDHDTWTIEADLDENVEIAVRYLREEAQVAIEGVNGDDMAYRTGAMCKSFGLSPETAFDLMWQHWNPRCIPPWQPEEAEHLEYKVANAYRYNTSPPGNMTQAYKVAKQRELFQPVSRDTKGGGREAEVGRFRFVDERGIANINPPEWLIVDAIPQGAYAMLIGARGTYKTFIALDMALSVAVGGAQWYEDSSDWLGAWSNVIGSGPVLFAAGEGRAGIKARVHAWRQHHLENEETGNFYLVDPVPYPDTEDVTAFIQGAIALSPCGYRLVVLDTVGRAMQGLNENSQQDASQFTRMVQTIQHELDCAVLAIHHEGHLAVGRARGSSVYGADVDTEFVVERYERNTVRMRNTKQKDSPEWDRAKLLEFQEVNGSLVTLPMKERKAEIVQEEEPVRGRRGPGRKTKFDVEVELGIIRTAAYQAMRAYPGKEWSKVQLANAISADERVSVAAGTVRNRYIDELMTDKKHPVAQCFDIGKQVWGYKPESK